MDHGSLKKHNRCSLHQTSDQSTDKSLSPSPGSLISPPHLPPFFLRLWLGIWPGDLGFQRANPHLPRSSNTGMFYLWLGLDNNLYLEGGVSVFFNVDGLFRINQNKEYHHLSFGGIIGFDGERSCSAASVHSHFRRLRKISSLAAEWLISEAPTAAL